MPDVYTTSLRLIDQTNGEGGSVWGDKCDTNFAILERAICGTLVKSVAGAGDTTLTNTDGALNEAQHSAYELTGVVTGNANVIVPTVTKKFTIFNNTTGAFTRTVKTSAGSGILVPQGKKMVLSCDGTNVVEDLSAVTQLAILGSIDETKGADIASAATTNIWATDGNYVVVTGVVGITSYGTAPRAGARRRVRHSGILIITNGANLICPGGANITTQVGDTYEVIADTTTQHRIVDYMRADGGPLALPATVPTLAGNNPFTGNNTFIRTDLTAPIQAGSTDAGAAEAVGIDLYRNSPTPAANDLLESLLFSGNSVTPTKRTMAKLMARLLDPTNTSEDAELELQTIVAGTLAARLILGQGLYTPGVAGGDKGPGAINFPDHFADGLQFAPFTDLAEDLNPDPLNDLLVTWDASAGAYKNVKVANLTADTRLKLGTSTGPSLTVAETSICSVSIPAGTLGAHGGLIATIAGFCTNNAGSRTVRLRVKFGGTTLYDDVSIAIPASATPRPFMIRIIICNNVVNNQVMIGQFSLANVAAAGTGLGDLATAALQDATFSSTTAGSVEDTDASPKTFAVTAELSAADFIFQAAATVVQPF